MNPKTSVYLKSEVDFIEENLDNGDSNSGTLDWKLSSERYLGHYGERYHAPCRLCVAYCVPCKT